MRTKPSNNFEWKDGLDELFIWMDLEFPKLLKKKEALLEITKDVLTAK